MKTKVLYIIIVALSAGLVAQHIILKRACDEQVAQAIQQTSDDLLEVCEAKIDEVLSQF